MDQKNNLQASWAMKWFACDPEVLKAVSAVYSNTTESQSWKSRKYSFTSLVRDHLDYEVLRFFEKYNIFAGELSISEYFKQGDFKALRWLDQIAKFQPPGGEFRDTGNQICYTHTIETIRDLVVFCSLFKGKDKKVWSVGNPEEGDGPTRKRARRAEGKTKFDELPWYFKGFLQLETGIYCELCGSYTSQYKYQMDYSNNVNTKQQQENSSNLPLRINGGSSRYCKDHDPELSHGSYKRASTKRNAFYSLRCIIHEGEKLFLGRVRSHPEDIRKAAFSVVQSFEPKDLKEAEMVVKRFYSSLDDPTLDMIVLDMIVLESDMRKAYINYFGEVNTSLVKPQF